MYILYAFLITDECFVVRPDNSDDQRRIGARGNLCLLHVSQWGITAALQVIYTSDRYVVFMSLNL